MKKSFKGMATPTAVIFTMVSMLITAGYLKYALSASVSQKYRFEEAKALRIKLDATVGETERRRIMGEIACRELFKLNPGMVPGFLTRGNNESR